MPMTRGKSKMEDSAPAAEEGQVNGEDTVVLNITESGDLVAVGEDNQTQGQEVPSGGGNLLEQAFVETAGQLQEGTTVVQAEGLESGATAVLEDGTTVVQVTDLQQVEDGATVVASTEQLEDGSTAVHYAVADGNQIQARIMTADELEAQNIRLVNAETGAEIQTVQGIIQEQQQEEQPQQQQQQQSLLKPGIAQLLGSGKNKMPSTVKLLSSDSGTAPIGSSQNPIRIVQQGKLIVRNIFWSIHTKRTQKRKRHH